jgi:hypothetical protein
MRSKLLIGAAAVLLWTAQVSTGHTASIVTEWLDEVLPAANEVAWEPTVGARFLAIVYDAVYDAWAAYDPVAVGCVTGTALKGEGGANNLANKREALSHAAYTVLRTLAPQRRHALAAWMQALGYEPNASTAPAKLGRRAALAVLAARSQDGADAAGDFADTTGYAPTHTGAPDAWRPIDYFGRPQLPTTPQWGRVEPFSLTQADQFRPPPPPAPGTAEWARQTEVLIDASRDLTDAQKATAEYWAPWGSSPAPHLLEITKFVSNSDDLRLDEDVKLFFVATNAVLDASIATWEAKYVYDYVRPITVIQALGDRRITAWRPRSLPTAFAYSAPLTRGRDDADAAAVTAAMRADEGSPICRPRISGLCLRSQCVHGCLGARHGACDRQHLAQSASFGASPVCRAARADVARDLVLPHLRVGRGGQRHVPDLGRDPLVGRQRARSNPRSKNRRDCLGASPAVLSWHGVTCGRCGDGAATSILVR